MIKQAFGEESMNHIRKVQTERGQKGRDWWRAKSRKSMFIIFFDIKGIIHKEFVLASQTVPHTAVTFCSDCVKIRPEI
jgi:hypothetical protein